MKQAHTDTGLDLHEIRVSVAGTLGKADSFLADVKKHLANVQEVFFNRFEEEDCIWFEAEIIGEKITDSPDLFKARLKAELMETYNNIQVK